MLDAICEDDLLLDTSWLNNMKTDERRKLSRWDKKTIFFELVVSSKTTCFGEV
jgi:hypothetical protein